MAIADKPRFVSYHVNASFTRVVPIATGHSREECQALAIVRTLLACEDGGISTQRRDDIDLSTFTQLTEFLNNYFMKLDAGVRRGRA